MLFNSGPGTLNLTDYRNGGRRQNYYRDIFRHNIRRHEDFRTGGSLNVLWLDGHVSSIEETTGDDAPRKGSCEALKRKENRSLTHRINAEEDNNIEDPDPSGINCRGHELTQIDTKLEPRISRITRILALCPSIRPAAAELDDRPTQFCRRRQN